MENLYKPCTEVYINISEETVKKVFNWLYETSLGKKTMLVFESSVIEASSTKFVLVHGGGDGTVGVNNTNKTLETLLRELIESGEVDPSVIKTVLTISCYGGTQPIVEIDGVTIMSIHNCITEIDISVVNNKLHIDLVPNFGIRRKIKHFYSKFIFAAVKGAIIGDEFAERVKSYFKK